MLRPDKEKIPAPPASVKKRVEKTKSAEDGNNGGNVTERGQKAAAWFVFGMLAIGFASVAMFLAEANQLAPFLKFFFTCSLIDLAKISTFGTIGTILASVVVAGAGYALRVEEERFLYYLSLGLAGIFAFLLLGLSLGMGAFPGFWDYFDNLPCAVSNLDLSSNDITDKDVKKAVRESVTNVDALFWRAFGWVFFIIAALFGVRLFEQDNQKVGGAEK